MYFGKDPHNQTSAPTGPAPAVVVPAGGNGGQGQAGCGAATGFECALETEAAWSTYLNASETTVGGLKSLMVTRNSKVVAYFEKKTLQAVSAAAVIADDSDAKIKATATKTALDSKATAEKAASDADAKVTEAI